MAKCCASVPPLTAQAGVVIIAVPIGKRQSLEWILEESFEGWYLMHSKRTLQDVELVKAAMSSGKPVGLVMVKMPKPARNTVLLLSNGR